MQTARTNLRRIKREKKPFTICDDLSMVRIIYNRLDIASEHPLIIRTNGSPFYYGFLDIFFRAVVNVEVG